MPSADRVSGINTCSGPKPGQAPCVIVHTKNGQVIDLALNQLLSDHSAPTILGLRDKLIQRYGRPSLDLRGGAGFVLLNNGWNTLALAWGAGTSAVAPSENFTSDMFKATYPLQAEIVSTTEGTKLTMRLLSPAAYPPPAPRTEAPVKF